jgi:thiazole/oxazole-forming peptide maturase SagD family component
MNRTEPVTAYRENLPPGDLIDFSYTGLDRLGVPAYSTALWPENGAFCNGLGYGTSEAEAMTSAFGELFESAAACERLPRMPRTRGSYEELVRRRGESGVLDPLQACLEAGTVYDPGMVLNWVEARRFPGGEAVLVPVELAATRFADLSPEEQREERLFTPITNGLGAGPSLEHALSHALLELVQRDGNSVDYRALDREIAVSTETSDTETRDLLAHLDREGVEVIVKLATSDLGMTNLYVVGYDRDPEDAPHPLALSACGEAAHPNRELALRKALLEYVAARARKLFNHAPLSMIEPVAPPGYLDRFRGSPLGSEETRSLEEMLRWLSLSPKEMYDLLEHPIYAVRSQVAFSDLPHTELDPGDRAELLGIVTDRLSDAGLDVLYVDYSSPNGDVSAVKAIVPGLEVETMSYGRIGPRNLRLLLDRDSDLVVIGDAGRRPAARRILLTPEWEAELGPAWLDYDAVGRTVGNLYPLYREPGRHVAALAAEGWGDSSVPWA